MIILIAVILHSGLSREPVLTREYIQHQDSLLLSVISKQNSFLDTFLKEHEKITVFIRANDSLAVKNDSGILDKIWKKQDRFANE